eukprot:761941-Hanusia_phi.AAC.1
MPALGARYFTLAVVEREHVAVVIAVHQPHEPLPVRERAKQLLEERAHLRPVELVEPSAELVPSRDKRWAGEREKNEDEDEDEDENEDEGMALESGTSQLSRGEKEEERQKFAGILHAVNAIAGAVPGNELDFSWEMLPSSHLPQTHQEEDWEDGRGRREVRGGRGRRKGSRRGHLRAPEALVEMPELEVRVLEVGGHVATCLVLPDVVDDTILHRQLLNSHPQQQPKPRSPAECCPLLPCEAPPPRSEEDS